MFSGRTSRGNCGKVFRRMCDSATFTSNGRTLTKPVAGAKKASHAKTTRCIAAMSGASHSSDDWRPSRCSPESISGYLGEYTGVQFTITARAFFFKKSCMHWSSRPLDVVPRIKRTAVRNRTQTAPRQANVCLGSLRKSLATVAIGAVELAVLSTKSSREDRSERRNAQAPTATSP